MSSAFQLSPSVATLPLSLLRKRYEDMTPEERIAAGLVRPATQAEFDASQGGSGAPADFAGRVFPNPNNVQISDDTDSGIPALRLPNGVSATTGAYNGTPKLDTSNPAQAQVLPAAMQTVGAKTTPDEHGPWEDYSAKSTPESGPWDDYAPKESATPKQTPSVYSRLKENFLSTLGVTTDDQAKSFFEHLIDPSLNNTVVTMGKSALKAQGELATKAKEAYDKGDYKEAVRHGLDYLLPMIGPSLDKAGTQLNQGDIAGGVGTTLGVAAPIVAASPEVQALPGKTLSAAADVAVPAVRTAAKAVRAVDPDVVGIVSPRAAHGLKVAQRAAKVAEKYTAPAEEAAATATVKEPPTVEPEVEDLEGKTSSQTESAGETPDEHVPEETPQKKTLADLAKPADTSPKNLNRLLKTATGAAPEAPKTVPGVKIKNQPAAQSALPADFTASPKESSVLKGYKYNAAAQELDGITNTGARYRHGQVTPDQFAQFEKDAADSPGKAWNNLRNAPGVEPLGKVDASGKLTPRVKPQSMRSAEVDPETGQPEFSDALAQKKKNLSDFIKPSEPQASAVAKPTSKKLSDLSGEGDLTSLLKDSVKQAKNKSAGVPKSAYDQAINDAMKEGPAWTPEKAKPVVDALNKNEGVTFEARGSVGEGRSTENDLDLYQKSGDLSDAHDTLKELGFKYNGKTPHGETWTNGAQHIDLWDSEHEPIKGYKGRAVTRKKVQ